ncbi:hypothetical protein AYO44_09065 [Planctomycetaceae bacterium SCGC AG-212-F19]|nr:hypothetical protein AYO44_09065 [Planctomycetaceae bacterium SCGC AG-212-F19]
MSAQTLENKPFPHYPRHVYQSAYAGAYTYLDFPVPILFGSVPLVESAPTIPAALLEVGGGDLGEEAGMMEESDRAKYVARLKLYRSDKSFWDK